MKHNIRQLSGPLLNRAVADLIGMSYWHRAHTRFDVGAGFTDWVLDLDGVIRKYQFDESSSRAGSWRVKEIWDPLNDWDQLMPLVLERSVVVVPDRRMPPCACRAYHCEPSQHDLSLEDSMRSYADGSTWAEAALRCMLVETYHPHVEIEIT